MPKEMGMEPVPVKRFDDLEGSEQYTSTVR